MTKEYLDLKVDFMFKQLFGQPSRKHITIAVLNDLLGRKEEDKITNLTFENTEITKDREDGKIRNGSFSHYFSCKRRRRSFSKE